MDQLKKLITAVESERDRAARTKNPKKYKSSANTKLLAAINKLAFEQIPQDPTLPRYRQGGALGAQFKHWFREKFGNGRFRLFFRFDPKGKIIVYAWVNDDQTLRQYGSSSDAYAVFANMLTKGNPPDDWEALVKACNHPTILEGLAKQIKK